MLKPIITSSLFVAATVFIIACQTTTKNQPSTPPVDTKPVVVYTECHELRPEMCTREYRPVCAKRDTGVRCVTTPCPSTENVTKSNACTACSDVKVYGYTMGACK